MAKCTITLNENIDKAMLISAKVALHKDADLTTKVDRVEYALELFVKAIEQNKISIADLVNLK